MPKQNIKKRSLSRLMAIQIFYQRDFFSNARNLEEIKNDMVENYALNSEENISSYSKKIDTEFLDNLLAAVEIALPQIDEEISKVLKNGWSLDAIDDISRQILRCGTCELKFMHDIPTKVVLDEYVDIAASFFDQNKIKFVNAALDKLSLLRK